MSNLPLRLALVASCTFVLGVATPEAAHAAPTQTSETAKEGDSGHKYPVAIRSTLKVADAEKEGAEPLKLHLLGLAVREKTFLGVNVYSYALYVDEAFALEHLAGWKDKKGKALEKDETLFKTILKKPGTKELRLRFCRNVDAEDVVSAFEDSLKPRILKLKKKEEGSEAQKLKQLTAFRGMFKLDKLKTGKELRFTWHDDGTLSTVIDGKRQKDIEAPALARALFDVYIGKDPIMTGGKKKLVRRLPEVLKTAGRK